MDTHVVHEWQHKPHSWDVVYHALSGVELEGTPARLEVR
jgi:hypothetical protein